MGERILLIIQSLIGSHRGAMTIFAAKIGLKSGQVSDWIRGKANPGAEYRRKICESFGVSRDWLDTGEGEMLLSKPSSMVTEEPVSYTSVSDREVGRLEGQVQELHNQIDRYERRLDYYDREILTVLKNISVQKT